jgi:hypothetical protein
LQGEIAYPPRLAGWIRNFANLENFLPSKQPQDDFTMKGPAVTLSRKGVYQAFARDGAVLSDERWQAVRLPDGSIHVENETVRVAPFDEPRSDSVTYMLDAQLRLLDFTIHGLFGARESRVCVLGEARDAATICWRHKGDVHEQRVAFDERIELDWQSPLFGMVMVWRSSLAAGKSRTFDCWVLDPVSFAPVSRRYTLHNAGQETFDTRFGALRLWRYLLHTGLPSGERTFWCDDGGVLYQLNSDTGGYVLTARDVL